MTVVVTKRSAVVARMPTIHGDAPGHSLWRVALHRDL